MKTLTLSTCTVELADSVNWGMKEEIKAAMIGSVRMSALSTREQQNIELNAANLVNAKYKAAELVVKKIVLNDGTTVPFSKEWMYNLSQDDGNALHEAVDEVTDAKKN